MRSFGETPGKREALLNKLVKLQETPVKREETPEKGEEPMAETKILLSSAVPWNVPFDRSGGLSACSGAGKRSYVWEKEK